METNTEIRRHITPGMSRTVIIARIGFYLLTAALLIVATQLQAISKYLLIVAIGVIIIMSALVKNLTFELEYFCNGERFFVDRVFGVSRKKTVLDIAISEISESAAAESEEGKALCARAEKVLDFSSSEKDAKKMCFFSEERKLAFIIEADDELLGALTQEIKNEN